MTSESDQVTMFYKAERRAGEINETFLWLVANGLTQNDLKTNIMRRPSLWKRFETWIDKLPA